MDLFKLQADIEILIDKALSNIDKLSDKVDDIAEQIQSKIATKTEADIDTGKAISNLTRLNSTISRQESELESLKNQYTDVVLAQGKNSTSAKQLASQIDKLSGELNDNKNKLNNAKKEADKLDNSLDNLDGSARGAGGGFTVLKGAVANLLSAGFQKLLQVTGQLISSGASYQSSMEQYNTSFEVMTGSAEKAVEVTDKLGQIASSTPFELPCEMSPSIVILFMASSAVNP